jgi:hypothetical protein
MTLVLQRIMLEADKRLFADRASGRKGYLSIGGPLSCPRLLVLRERLNQSRPYSGLLACIDG